MRLPVIKTGSGLSAGAGAALADFPPGRRVTITGTAAGLPAVTARRLRDLGFTEGAEVEVIRRALLRDPVLYQVRGYQVCLRRTEAAYLLARLR